MSRDYQTAADLDDAYDEQEGTLVAFRRFVNELAGTRYDDVGPMEATYRALDEIDRLSDRVDELEQENIELRAQLESDRNTQPGSKKAAAMRIARNECLRQLSEGVERHSLSGEVQRKQSASVDVPTVREQARGQNVDLQYNTADRALIALAEKWDCFEHRDGSGMTTGKNKRVVITPDAEIPAKLWTMYHDDTGGKVPEWSTYTEIGSSEEVTD